MHYCYCSCEATPPSLGCPDICKIGKKSSMYHRNFCCSTYSFPQSCSSRDLFGFNNYQNGECRKRFLGLEQRFNKPVVGASLLCQPALKETGMSCVPTGTCRDPRKSLLCVRCRSRPKFRDAPPKPVLKPKETKIPKGKNCDMRPGDALPKKQLKVSETTETRGSQTRTEPTSLSEVQKTHLNTEYSTAKQDITSDAITRSKNLTTLNTSKQDLTSDLSRTKNLTTLNTEYITAKQDNSSDLSRTKNLTTLNTEFITAKQDNSSDLSRTKNLTTLNTEYITAKQETDIPYDKSSDVSPGNTLPKKVLRVSEIVETRASQTETKTEPTSVSENVKTIVKSDISALAKSNAESDYSKKLLRVSEISETRGSQTEPPSITENLKSNAKSEYSALVKSSPEYSTMLKTNLASEYLTAQSEISEDLVSKTKNVTTLNTEYLTAKTDNGSDGQSKNTHLTTINTDYSSAKQS